MNENKKQTTKSDKIINLVIALVVIVFVVVGVYATYGKISEGIKDKAIESGEAEATVAYIAKQSGMSIEDYLAQYGLSVNETINENTTESVMVENMTIENYALYNGTTAEEMLSGLGEKVTKDTIFKDYMQMPTIDVLGSDEIVNQVKEQYGMGDDVTADMSWEEFQTKLVEAAQAAALAATPAPEAATEAPAAE